MGILPPGVTPHSQEELTLLDDEQEWIGFSQPSAQHLGCWESSVLVEGMHCAACALAVEDILCKVPGVRSAHVGAANHRARVVWVAEQVKPSQWMEAMQHSGYRALPANDQFASDRRRTETRQALWRWLVAGLCMMQVMMYAYPAYVAQAGDLTPEMERLLRWASWVLTLPVMLFSCGPFFKNAMRDIAHARISMDLPVALGILITFVFSTVGTFEPTGPFGREVYFDSLTMFVFFLLTGRWLELRLRDRTAGALESLMNRLPDSVERLAGDGAFERIAARRIAVGDLVRVHPGETFVADGCIEFGDTQVDEALLTGESRPIRRGLNALVLSGSYNLSGLVHVRVTTVGRATRFAQIVALMESASATKPQTAQLADRLAKPFLIGVLLLAAGACAWWWSRDPGHAVMVAVAVLVVTCPCALSLATPVAMLAASGTLARAGIMVRRMQALEILAKVDTFVFDKTGTLTLEAMAVGAVEVRNGITRATVLAMAHALAQNSLHPVSKALSVAAVAEDVDLSLWQASGVIETAGQGIRASVRNVSALGPDCGMQLRLGSAQFCSVAGDSWKAARVFLSDAQGWLASFELTEGLRPQAADLITDLAYQDVRVQLLSGDQHETVTRVANQLGIKQARGACSPDDKLTALRSMQNQGSTVAMVGDGLNDGPILAGANVSFALGHGVPLAQAQADFVVLGDQLRGVALAVRLSRRTMAVVRQNLWWALGYNVACVPLAVIGWLPAWLAGLGMASSSLFVVLNSLRLTRNASLQEVS